MPFLGLLWYNTILRKTNYMNTMIKSLQDLIAQPDITFTETNKVTGSQSEYFITWKSAGTRGDAVTSFTVTYLFDMDSFLLAYRELYPENTISEMFVLRGIAYLFHEVAEHVLTMGSQGYEALAEKLYQKRGAITGVIYGF